MAIGKTQSSYSQLHAYRLGGFFVARDVGNSMQSVGEEREMETRRNARGTDPALPEFRHPRLTHSHATVPSARILEEKAHAGVNK